MGINRDSRHKRRATGGRMPIHQKKRKFEMGRQPTMTKLGPKRVRPLRTRGGNLKWRALKIDGGNFSWGSEAVSRKTRVLDVVYNATNNELVRTKTLVKNCIVLIDANPLRQWYLKHYDVELNKKKVEESDAAKAETKRSRHLKAKLKQAANGRVIDQKVADQFNSGRLLACISSRPGQSGRLDGYVLEGKELEFYQKKLEKKKGK
jgi:small subunit ribosomal protein S8e|tara:strand:- start:241 stop:858 length:618 start_codon:yes stop_codon:yes gene_type:complete